MTPATVEELHRELRAEEDERVAAGYCACGCPERVSAGGNGRRRFVNERHRKARYRYRLEREAELVGLTTSLNLEKVRMAETTGPRPGDAQPGARKHRRAPRPGVTLYLPSVELAEELAVTLAPIAPDVVELLDPAIARTRRRLGLPESERP